MDFGDYGEIDYGTRSQFFAFRGAELTIALGNFASLSGTFMIVREGTGSDAVLLVTGTDVLASIGVNPIEISVTASAFALLLYSLEDDTAVFAAHAEGTVAFSGIFGLALSGTIELQANTTGEQVVDFGDYGSIDYLTSEDSFTLRGTGLVFAIDSFRQCYRRYRRCRR